MFPSPWQPKQLSNEFAPNWLLGRATQPRPACPSAGKQRPSVSGLCLLPAPCIPDKPRSQLPSSTSEQRSLRLPCGPGAQSRKEAAFVMESGSWVQVPDLPQLLLGDVAGSECHDREYGLWSQTSWAGILPLQLTSCVALASHTPPSSSVSSSLSQE